MGSTADAELAAEYEILHTALDGVDGVTFDPTTHSALRGTARITVHASVPGSRSPFGYRISVGQLLLPDATWDFPSRNASEAVDTFLRFSNG